MSDSGFSIEFYADEHGDRPAHRWITRDLSVRQRRLLGVAMFHFLQRYGAEVCSSEFGKALGGGLYEFRVRHDLPELLRRAGIEHGPTGPGGSRERVLLRVFFSVHGDRVVVVLGGYDKAKAPGVRRQQAEIATARARLADWKRRTGTRDRD